jgi:RNA polymerase sigma-70 factor, ECF subfamily
MIFILKMNDFCPLVVLHIDYYCMGVDLLDEKDLIRKAKKGDTLALSKLIQQNYSFLVKYLMKVTLHPQIAEDLSQETMMKCIEKIQLYNGESKFSSWLITIATNLFIDQQRRKKREKKWLEQEQALRKLKWNAANMNEEWTDVLDVLAQIDEEIRMPIVLKHYYGYTYEEIGKMMGIAEGTVKSRVSNGLKSIRKELTEREGV